MQIHLSLGVGTLVALMEAHRPAGCRPAPNAEEAARIDAWLQGDMLPGETEPAPGLGSEARRPT